MSYYEYKKLNSMAGRINELKKDLEVALRDKSKPWTPVFDTLEEKLCVDRVFLFIGFVSVLCLWLVFGFAGQLVCNTVVFLYPAYLSIKAIETPDKEDDTKLLIFWVVFALFSVLEYFVNKIVCWFPMYWLVKCLFFFWLIMPSDYNGSLVIYKKFILPKFLKHQEQIDSLVNSASNLVEKKK